MRFGGSCVAKRFTDTDKWKRPFFYSMTDKQKLAWIYLLDDCDHRGVWLANFKRISFDIGVEIDEPTLASWFGSHLVKFDEDKYFIPAFVEFQYGKLNEDSRVHRGIIEFLRSSMDTLIEPYARSMLTLKDKDKEQDKDIAKAMDKEKAKAQNQEQDKDQNKEPKQWQSSFMNSREVNL